MNNTVFKLTIPVNEPVQKYLPQSKESKKLEVALKSLLDNPVEIPLIIGGKEIKTGNVESVYMPHNHKRVLATYHVAGPVEAEMAIKAALKAKEKWDSLSWLERASITLKAAELVAGKYRYHIIAATMLGQGKNIHQAEIDAACETVDYLRFNAYFASGIYAEQPKSEVSMLNRIEYRPLEGFIYTITPFNFTAIASNLNMAPVLMGNTTVWKPSTGSILSSYLMMKVFMEAGLPGGVINFIPGPPVELSNVILSDKNLAGIHFTGSTATMNSLWKSVAGNIGNYRSYPRLVGETGGKDFVFVHNSAKADEVATALVRGAFEYQGQKCSAASRAYIPESMWDEVKALIKEMASEIKIGSVLDNTNFMNAVIDERAYKRIMNYIEYARESEDAEIITGGNGDCSVGWFIEPTVIRVDNPRFVTMEEEIFGPVLSVYVYPDEEYEETLKLCDATSPYALTGAIFSNDRYATMKASEILRYAAGNFYINDKPTGAVVGQQPFGGARASGTNDKAGGNMNLTRWISPRTIKETFVPDTDYKYPFMKKGSCSKAKTGLVSEQ